MTELAYGHGLNRHHGTAEVRLHDIDLVPDVDYAELLLKVADAAILSEADLALDYLLFALCWARFDLTIAGEAARRTWLSLGMDRSGSRRA